MITWVVRGKSVAQNIAVFLPFNDEARNGILDYSTIGLSDCESIDKISWVDADQLVDKDQLGTPAQSPTFEFDNRARKLRLRASTNDQLFRYYSAIEVTTK